jgi:hypothetical protein
MEVHEIRIQAVPGGVSIEFADVALLLKVREAKDVAWALLREAIRVEDRSEAVADRT